MSPPTSLIAFASLALVALASTSGDDCAVQEHASGAEEEVNFFQVSRHVTSRRKAAGAEAEDAESSDIEAVRAEGDEKTPAFVATAEVDDLELLGSNLIQIRSQHGVGGDVDYGDPKCPCVGVEGLGGKVILMVNGSATSYSSDVGARCDDWDNNVHSSCRDSFGGVAPPPWCAQKWCYVDPCNCNIGHKPWETQGKPAPTHYGRTVYFSYSTCGEIPTWKAGDDPTACVSKETQDACVADSKCEYTLDDGCVGRELAGAACTSTTTPAPSPSASGPVVATSYGDASCQCLGLGNRNGTLNFAPKGLQPAEYPADIGSSCQAWDQDTSPCDGADGEVPDWCGKRWCYVDPCSCSLTGAEPPDRAAVGSHQGRPLYYSYDTCGDTDTFTNETNPQACKMQLTEDTCTNPECAWTSWSGCVGKELATSCLKHVAAGGSGRTMPELLAFLAAMAFAAAH